MNRKRRLVGSAVASFVLAIAATGPATSQIMLEERVTAAAVVGSSPLAVGTTVRAAVEIQVGHGFHVNSNPASEDFLIPTAVSVTSPGIEVVEVFYPDPMELTFGFWPEPLKVWEGDVVAGVVLRVTDAAALGDAELEFVVDYQACNDEACFAPTQTTARVPVMIAAAGSATRAVESPLLDRARFESD